MARALRRFAQGSWEEPLLFQAGYWRSLAVAYLLILGVIGLFPHACSEPRSRVLTASLVGVAGMASSIERLASAVPRSVPADGVEGDAESTERARDTQTGAAAPVR